MTGGHHHTVTETGDIVRTATTRAIIALRPWLVVLFVASLLVGSAAEAQLRLYVTNQQGEAGNTPGNAIVVYEVSVIQAPNGRRLELERKVVLDADVVSSLSAKPAGIAATQDMLVVASQPNRFEPGGFVAVYDRAAVDSSVASILPRWIIKGGLTGLNRPFGVAVAPSSARLFVANQASDVGEGSITVYDLARLIASPDGTYDLAPVRTIVHPVLSGPSFLAFDEAHAELFVTNSYSGVIAIFKRTGDDLAFVREIRDDGTNPVQGLAGLVVKGDELFAARSLYPFSAEVSVYGREDQGTPDPRRALVGDTTKLDSPAGLALDDNLNALFVANTPKTTSGGFITAYDTRWPPDQPDQVPILAPYRDAPLVMPVGLFVPVGLAVAERAISCGEYTFTTSGDVIVPRGSAIDVRVRTTLVTGSGTVKFAVSGLPVSASGVFNPAECALSCETTLTVTTGSSTPAGSSTVIVTASADMAALGGEPRCTVNRSISFTLTVDDRPQGSLRLRKGAKTDAPGRGTVTSNPAGIHCGLDCSDVLRSFVVGSVVLEAAGEDPASDLVTGWDYPGCGPAPTCQVAITAGTTTNVTVFFDRRRITVTVNVDPTGSGTGKVTGSGFDCAGTCDKDFGVRTPLDLIAQPSDDSTFDRWIGCPSANGLRCTFAPTDATSVTALFTGPSLTVVKAGNGKGRVTSPTSPRLSCDEQCARTSATFRSGTPVTLEVAEVAGSRFTRWEGCTRTSADDRTCEVVFATPAATVTAVFSAAFALNVLKTDSTAQTEEPFRTHGSGDVRSDDGAISCGAVCSAVLDSGREVRLKATARDGSVFAGWEPGTQVGGRTLCEGDEPCVIRLSEDTTVRAYFGDPQEAFVARFYLNILDTRPPAAEVAQLIDFLDPKHVTLDAARAFVDVFLFSTKFQQRLQDELTPRRYVEAVYRAVLARQPSAGELKQRIVRIFQPVVEDLVAQGTFPGSEAFYKALLGIDDPTEEQKAVLTRSGVRDVALEILSGDRPRSAPGLLQDLIDLHRALAGHAPSATELAGSLRRVLDHRAVMAEEFTCGEEFGARFGTLFQPGYRCRPS